MTTTQEPTATSPDNGIVDGMSDTLENVSGALATGRENVSRAIATGRSVAAEQVPVMTANAKQAIGEAEARVERLSDVGLAAATGFALGVSAVLLLTGAPRIVLGLSAVPAAVMLRAAANRGMRPSALTNSSELV
jgi:hypothetical protein